MKFICSFITLSLLLSCSVKRKSHRKYIESISTGNTSSLACSDSTNINIYANRYNEKLTSLNNFSFDSLTTSTGTKIYGGRSESRNQKQIDRHDTSSHSSVGSSILATSTDSTVQTISTEEKGKEKQNNNTLIITLGLLGVILLIIYGVSRLL